MKKIFLTISFLYLLPACGSLGHKFDGLQTPNPNEALIYYYRPSKFIGSGIFYDVKENGNIVTTLYNGGYYPHRTTAGHKLVTAKTETAEEISFPVEKGQTYFVRGKVHMGIIAGRPAMKLIPKDKALKELQDCRIIEQDKK